MGDLIEVLESNNFTPSEIVELLSSVDKNEIEDYALEHMICTRCYSCLKMVRWREEREYMGSITYENFLEFQCDYCGETY